MVRNLVKPIVESLFTAPNLEFVAITVDPIMMETVEYDENFLEDQLTFHHDGSSTHYAVQFREFE